MATKKATVEAETAKGSRGDRRRDRILNGFRKCIIHKGYSKTTLRDVAKAADMSASHLLYYFSGKDAILQHYFDNVSERIRQRIDSFRDEEPERQFELLADLFFAGRGITNSETGFMLECFGVAVHDPQLHNEKAELDRFCKDYLQCLFAQLPRTRDDAPDHAEIAYSLLIGLRTAAFFDQRLSLSNARRLFREGVMRQAGLRA
ncbi:TetR/AcrR family transcriptional regulator [Elongatibacter sediminis]|uniref:TetR/AcrR family transcriptional regulator n=1 Tax=Elongatibacter sediminis TaxID=3119006 RepID=A0AAW9RAB0_9GAMM